MSPWGGEDGTGTPAASPIVYIYTLGVWHPDLGEFFYFDFLFSKILGGMGDKRGKMV